MDLDVAVQDFNDVSGDIVEYENPNEPHNSAAFKRFTTEVHPRFNKKNFNFSTNFQNYANNMMRISNFEFSSETTSKNKSQVKVGETSGVNLVYRSFINEDLYPKNLANAGLVLLPTFDKSQDRISYSFMEVETPMVRSINEELIEKPIVSKTMGRVSLKQNKTLAEALLDTESDLLDTFNEQYDYISAQAKKKFTEYRTFTNKKAKINLRVLSHKISEMEEEGAFYLDAFILTKEQYEEIPENLLVRKMQIKMPKDFDLNFFKVFTDEHQSLISKNNKKMIAIVVGLLLLIIALIVA